MTNPFTEDEEEDELLLEDPTILEGEDIVLDDEEESLEITLDDVEELEEEENTGHKLQTYDPADDGVDNYFDERYFDE